MKKYMMFGLLIVCGIIIAALLYKKQNNKGQNLNFVVGTAAGYAPFVSINADGDYEGFDIDIAQALAQQLGKKLEIKDLGSMTPLFMALEQGSIDAIMWGISITEDRLKKFAMVHYQGENVTSYPLIFWNKVPEGIASLADMTNMTICVEPASSQDAVLSKYSFITKLPTEKVDDALLNLQYGKADAAFVEPAIAKKFKNKYPEIQVLNIPLDRKDQVQGIGITLLPQNKSLINQIQAAITTLKSTGIIQQIEQKWGIV